MLWRALGDVGAGRYLDVGAGEPSADSVTRAFYERGWHGVNVEPLPGPFARLQTSRPSDVNLNVAAGAAPGEATFYVVGDETALSTLDPALAKHHQAGGWSSRKIPVRVTTLAEICASHVNSDLHFLKVDAEGAELDVLRGADFARWRPWIVLLEAPDPALPLPDPERWEAEVLTPGGYRFAWFDGLNRFYVAAEREAEMAPAFRVPPNVFDCFVRAAEAEAKSQLDAAQVAAQAAEARANAAREQTEEAKAQVAAVEVQAASLTEELARVAVERDAWAQELFETNRHAAELTRARQALLEEQARLHDHDAWRLADIAALRGHETRLLEEVAALRDHETRLLKEVAALAPAYHALLEEQARLRDHGARQAVEIAALRDHETRLLKEVAALRDHEARLLQEVAGLRVERDQARAAASDARVAAEDRARWMQAVQGSLSWRLTAPMRVVGRRIRRRG